VAPVTGTLPYDLDHLLGGAARVLVSDDEASLPAVPDSIVDVIDMESPYTPKTGWVDVGATTEGSTYSKDMDSDGYEIQQVSGFVFEEITEITRTVEITMGEIRPELVRIVENSGAAATVAAAAGASAQKSLAFGSFSQLDLRRVALVGQRNKKSGLVTESDATTERGRFVMVVLYSVALAAEASEFTIEKGELAALPVTLTAFPESGQSQGEEYGLWLFEDAGTIT
jgi:hypothetical protein